jgi:hypothetical protein
MDEATQEFLRSIVYVNPDVDKALECVNVLGLERCVRVYFAHSSDRNMENELFYRLPQEVLALIRTSDIPLSNRERLHLRNWYQI